MRRILIVLFLTLIFSVPMITLAQIVPCDGPDCNACHVAELGQRILTWLIGISALIIALIFVIGGLKMVIAGGNEGEVTTAKKMMTNSIVGFMILLAAWLIIDTVMKNLVNQSVIGESSQYGPWNEIKCVEPPPLGGGVAPGGGANPGTGPALNTAAVMVKYGEQIEQFCEGSSIPNCTETVAALIAAESAGKTDAISSKGALGIMQLLPSNGGALCEPNDSVCINKQIQTGINFLNNAYRTADGSLTKTLASYNGGAAAIAPSGCCPTGLAYQCPYDCGGRTDYRQCTGFTSVCQSNIGFNETRNYVDKICKAIGGCPN